VWRRAAARRASRSWLHRAACAWLMSLGCVFVFHCLWGVGFCLCPLRHDGALPFVPLLSGFSRGDLLWLLPRCFVRCGVGRGVARRVRCVASDGGTAGALVLVASCSVCVAYTCWLRFTLFFFQCLWGVFVFPTRHYGAISSVPFLSGFSRGVVFWLLPRCFVRCDVGRGVARRARCVAAGGGTAGVLVALCSLCVAYMCWLRVCISVLIGCYFFVSAHRVMMALFLPFHP